MIKPYTSEELKKKSAAQLCREADWILDLSYDRVTNPALRKEIHKLWGQVVEELMKRPEAHIPMISAEHEEFEETGIVPASALERRKGHEV